MKLKAAQREPKANEPDSLALKPFKKLEDEPEYPSKTDAESEPAVIRKPEKTHRPSPKKGKKNFHGPLFLSSLFRSHLALHSFFLLYDSHTKSCN